MSLFIRIRDLYNSNRIYIILAALIAGTIFTSLVEFSDPLVNDRWYKSLYHTLQFFVLSAEFPESGPWFAFYPLLFLYFLIPLMTVDFISTALVNVFYSFSVSGKKIYKFKNHVVVAGSGKAGEFLSRKFVQSPSSYKNAIIVDNNEQLVRKNQFLDNRIKYLLDDISRTSNKVKAKGPVKLKDLSFIEKTNLKDARLFVAITGDDFANLDAAILINDKADETMPQSFIQISDTHLYKIIKERHKELFENHKNSIHIINSYEIVAEKVIQEMHATENNLLQKSEILYVIAGFGNFGKMIFEQIIFHYKKMDSDHLNYCIHIIDNKNDIEDDIFFSSIDINIVKPEDNPVKIKGKPIVTYEISDIRKRETWQKLLERHREKSFKIIIATDNDVMNLGAAMRMQKIIENNLNLTGKDIKIVCRFFKYPQALFKKDNARLKNELITLEACTFSEYFHTGLMKEIEKQTNAS